MTDQNTQQTNDGTGGTGTQPAWYGADTNKEFVETKGFKSFDDVRTSYVNLEKLPGLAQAGRTVVLPKDETDVEGTKTFRAKMGVPEKADGYKVPDNIKDDPLTPIAAAAAHKYGIPAKAFEGFLADVLGAAGKSRTDAEGKAQADSETALGEIKAAWGTDFDKNAELARRIVRTGGIEEADLAKMEGALGTAKFLKMFHALGTKIAEPGSMGGEGGGDGAVAQAKQALDELRAKRIEGKIGEKDYLEQAERLGKIASRAA